MSNNNEKNDVIKDKQNSLSDKDNSTIIKVKSAVPRKRQDLLKWYGWGYNDSKFEARDGVAYFTGDRYHIGGKFLPHFAPWVLETFKVDVQLADLKPASVPTPKYPDSNITEDLLAELESISTTSIDGLDRLIRSHGQTLRDISNVRSGNLPRIPDAVVWPKCHEDVVSLVRLASKRKFVIIPYGGGTSVSGSISCPANEPRIIVALDTSDMNSILWIDKEQLLARCQSGILGQDLEREMRSRGFTVGHEPDSYEFSTLGGWVATRASGMKKNAYGNIEDIIVQTKTVTPKGILERGCRVPRISTGPDWEHVVMGSEGCFGVVTEVTLKIRPLPSVIKYGSFVFPDYESGFMFVREVARKRLQPASIRLMDNEQFRFGHALRTSSSWGGVLLDGLKMSYITKIKGFRPDKLCVATILFEGSDETEVKTHEGKLTLIARNARGIPAGSNNGMRGYTLTFVIAYIRDLALDYHIVAESFETSVPWDRTLDLCRNVKRRLGEECAKHGIKHFLASCRLTQTYDAGCAIYFYFAFNSRDCADSVAVYEDIEEKARDEIIANGGSISHHHGVGKLRKKWYRSTVSDVGQQLLFAAKHALDPDNIFALANMALSEDNKAIKSKL